MAIHGTLKDLSIAVIDEYLTAAKLCVQTRKYDGILGYPATLLLLCVTDAIGHSASLRVKGGDMRFDVLNDPIFGSNNLTDKQIKKLKSLYRNGLAHNGLIAPGVYLTADSNGGPFEFDHDGVPTLIRVPVFYDLVKRAWERHRGVFEPSGSDSRDWPNPSAQSLSFESSFASVSSGTTQTHVTHVVPVGKNK